MTAVPPVAIRPVRGADLPRLAELEELSFADPWPVELLAIELVHPQAILLAASRERVLAAGYVALRHGGGEAEILRLAVEPGERRRGLARALVEGGLERLRRAGVSVCHLEVRAGNQGAIAFYEALGFARTGRRPRYYRDGTDALIYARSL
ncbi:MAG TPA: ribosomal protein S18-alanine N-acetyltransferase [Thermoanaerobaculia bacterium]|nr:ribosomal protein S18-alanine N-acetyltransferase [Thermoanaerobaculia bacterium]